MRGEQKPISGICVSSLGSPPLARGTVAYLSGTLSWSRITPACAGNSSNGDSGGGCHGDHPRLRGEQASRSIDDITKAGSPPLARGTAATDADGNPRTGITPACAGNRYSHHEWARCRWDHPRLRGEQQRMWIETSTVKGSPPLARGTDGCHQRQYRCKRITPACAGNRFYHRYIPTSRGDHPRLRGEQFHFLFHFFGVKGSPPLARGTELNFMLYSI